MMPDSESRWAWGIFHASIYKAKILPRNAYGAAAFHFGLNDPSKLPDLWQFYFKSWERSLSSRERLALTELENVLRTASTIEPKDIASFLKDSLSRIGKEFAVQGVDQFGGFSVEARAAMERACERESQEALKVLIQDPYSAFSWFSLARRFEIKRNPYFAEFFYSLSAQLRPDKPQYTAAKKRAASKVPGDFDGPSNFKPSVFDGRSSRRIDGW